MNGPDSSYHETLMRFWIEIASVSANAARIDEVGGASSSTRGRHSGKRDLFKEYWSFDVVKSREARAGWIAPDQKSL